ncbi:MAG TPA: adenosylcobinamide-phosphate synthase CbiB [Acidimicrobiales bacterium]
MTNRPHLPRPLGAAAGIFLDRLLGEPTNSLHPVVHFGRVMDSFENSNYRDAKGPGLLHATTGAALGIGTGRLIRSTAIATGLAVGGRALHRAANNVAEALAAGDLERARELMPSLVGRDPSNLDANEMARAVVESVAENTVDAVVAPVLWAAVAGAPGAFGYRAVNTMDAMVGHRSARYEHYGWAGARLDDVANWVPARCTAVLVTLVRPKSANDVRVAVTTQAPHHPSPNSGVAEAAFAAALGIQLGGRSQYGDRVEERPALGHGRRVQPSDIGEAVRLSRDVTTALCVLLSLIGVRQWWKRR